MKLTKCGTRISTKDLPLQQKINEHETFVVQFALDNPPFIPDLHLSAMELAEGKYPLVTGDYFAWDMYYRFEYFCRQIDATQSLLWICGTVVNEGEKDQTAHIRAKVNFQRECDLFDYHYTPFYWDSTKWPECKNVTLKGDQIQKDGSVIGRVLGDEFSCAWETQTAFTDTDYNKKFGCSEPYFVTPSLRLKAVQDVIHFQRELKPCQKKSFAIALLVNFEAIQPNHVKMLKTAAFDTDRQTALQYFKTAGSCGGTALEFEQDRWNKIFCALQISTLQMLVKFPDQLDLMPTQGGSSERHFVWVWEAVFMLRPMLRLGHFEPVRRSLDFIFSLQDAGCPPEGKFTTIKGAIGTTGPKWMNSTGSGLALASDYYLFNRDEAFLKAYLPKIEKAANWIVGELRATRTLNADGTRPSTYGLMPFGCATDGDIGHIVAFTDAFTFWGLEKTVRLLETIHHPRAVDFRNELELYREDIEAAIKFMTRPDGYIERKMMNGEASVCNKFETVCSALHMAYTGNLDVHTETFERFRNYFETKLMDGPFTGRMDREICYMGTGDYVWFHTYLRRREWKKAFTVLRTNFRYGMTQDTFQVQERFSRRNPAFAPWQPNGSGNGRILDMMLDAIYFEYAGTAVLLGAVPFAWLMANEKSSLKNLHTERGKIDIAIHRLDHRQCSVKFSADSPACLPRRMCIPEHFAAVWKTSGVHDKGQGVYDLPEGISSIDLIISEKETI